MGSQYSPWLKTDQGFPLNLLENHLGFTYTKSLNKAGWFSIAYPIREKDSKDPLSIQNNLVVDRQIQIIRRKDLLSSGYLDFFGFLRKWTFNTGEDGGTIVTLSGPDQNDLLKRRIIAYPAGSDEAQALNPNVDDSMVDVVNENLAGGATDTDRDLSGFGFEFGWAQGIGPDIRKRFAWRNLEKVLSDLSAAARGDGSELYFRINVSGINADGSAILTFGAYNGAPGGNRTWTGAGASQAMIFGLKWGNLSNPVLSYDYSNEINYVYTGGPGEGTAREIVEVEDSNRVQASVWNRREGFADARQEITTEQITAKGKELLNIGRPIVRFSGTILSTDQTPYGSGWDLGSLVTVEYRGIKFNGLVRNVQITVTPQGAETVSSSIEFIEQI